VISSPNKREGDNKSAFLDEKLKFIDRKGKIKV
jgi:hypothetical protein